MTTVKEFLEKYQNWTPGRENPLNQQYTPGGMPVVFQGGGGDGGAESQYWYDQQRDLWNALSKGLITPGADEFSSLLSDSDGELSAGEFARFSPEVQKWAKEHPQEFAASLLKYANKESGDLGSIGAEGGYSNPELVTAGLGGLDFSNAGYMAPQNEFWDSQDFWGPIIVGGLAAAGAGGYLGGANTGLTTAEQGALFNGLGDTTADIIAGEAAGSTGGLTFDGMPIDGESYNIMNTAADGGSTPWNPINDVPQASYPGPAGSTPIFNSEGIAANMLPGGTIADVGGAGGLAASLGLTGGGGSTALGGLLKTVAPDLVKAVISGVATNSQKKELQDLANKVAGMANPGSAFQQTKIWPALANEIDKLSAGNKDNTASLANLNKLIQSSADPNGALRTMSNNGYSAANNLVTDPMSNSGYSLADQAAKLYASLNGNPYSNPLIQGTLQNALEASARKNALAGRLHGGNFLADSQMAGLGAVIDASGKLGSQYGNAINNGMNMYDTQFKDALALGTGAGDQANKDITASAAGMNGLANLKQADTNYLRDLGSIAGFGSPESAANNYNSAATAAAGKNPWFQAAGSISDSNWNKLFDGAGKLTGWW